jgi:autotransporter-associated beta strand protein
VFSGVANPSLLPQLTANTTIMGLNFTNAATGYTISTANNSVLTLSSSYSGLVTAGSSPAIWAQNTTGTNRISTALVLTPTTTSTWFQAKGGTLEVTGNISEGGTGPKQLSLASGVGTGTTSYYYLSGSNSYTGLTTIAGGALLTLGSANVLGTTAGATTINGTIDLNGYSITGEAITGGGKGHDSASGFLVNNSATAASVTGSTLALSSASGNIIGGTGNMTIGSAISGAANNALTKVGTGEITLAGNNTYAGLITVSVGTLTLSGNNSGASSSISVSTGAVLNINSANALGTGTLITSGSGCTINNTSGLAVINAGTNAITLGSLTTFGTTSSTSANDLDLGTGTVTAGGNPLINFAGTNTILKMGTLNSTRINTAGSPTGATLTANNTGSGAGNTLMFDGFKLGSAALNNITVQINGSANVAFKGIIQNSGSFANGIAINNTATTTFAGDNTYTGLTIMNAAAGTLTLSGNNSAASGGVTLTAGTLNVNSANALGSGALTLTAGTINNTSGAAVVNAGSNDVTWSSGFTFGTAGSTATNNLNLGMGKVTVSTAARSITFAGNNTELTMGILDCNYTPVTSAGVIYTANGPGNTLVINSYNIRSESLNNAVDNIEGSANWTFNGVIANGNGRTNGLNIKSTGVTTFNGTNTYTGKTVVYNDATLRVNGSLVSPVTVNSNGVIGGSGTISALTNSTGGILEAALNSTWNTAGTLKFETNSIVRVVGGTPSGSTPYTLVVAATSISTNTMPILNPSFSGWELAVVGGTNLVLRTTGGGGDTTAPDITRIGSASIIVAWGASYTDAGATATDNVDGSVTVTPSGSVNTAVPGIYTITYNARDAANNNAAAVTRTVTVSAPSSEVGADGLSGLLLYAFGANGPSDTVTKPTSMLSGGNLVITAIVRTDNPRKLTVVGQAVTDLANYASGSSIVTVLGSAVGVDQTSVPSGCQRQTFTVAQGEDMSKFLRLSATLVP